MSTITIVSCIVGIPLLIFLAFTLHRMRSRVRSRRRTHEDYTDDHDFGNAPDFMRSLTAPLQEEQYQDETDVDEQSTTLSSSATIRACDEGRQTPKRHSNSSLRSLTLLSPRYVSPIRKRPRANRIARIAALRLAHHVRRNSADGSYRTDACTPLPRVRPASLPSSSNLLNPDASSVGTSDPLTSMESAGDEDMAAEWVAKVVYKVFNNVCARYNVLALDCEINCQKNLTGIIAQFGVGYVQYAGTDLATSHAVGSTPKVEVIVFREGTISFSARRPAQRYLWSCRGNWTIDETGQIISFMPCI